MKRADRPQRAAAARYVAYTRKIRAEAELELLIARGMDAWADVLQHSIVSRITAGGPLERADALNHVDEAARAWLVFLQHGLLPRLAALFREAFTEQRTQLPGALTAAAEPEDDFERAFRAELDAINSGGGAPFSGPEAQAYEAEAEALFGEEFNAERKSADHSAYRYEQEHIAQVHDRLVIWPDGAWEEMRPEIEEALAEGESINQVRDRIAHVIGTDSETRRIRADIADIDRELMRTDLTSNERAELQARRRTLWQQHDESTDDWEYNARRVARTEVQMAVEGGHYQASVAAEAETGVALWRRWLCVTGDTRVRAEGVTHIARRRHVGTVVTIHTRAGRSITTTPEHRVLTSRGWIPAQFAHKGDELLHIAPVDPVEAPDVQDVPANIAEAFDAAMQAEPVEVWSMPVAVDLYGETVHGQVEVVPTDRDLAADLVPGFGERGVEFVLPPADRLAESLLLRERRTDDRADGLSAPTVCLGRSQAPSTLPLGVALNSELPGLTVTTERNTRVGEHTGDRRPGDADRAGDGSDGIAAGVPVDDLRCDGGAIGGAPALVLCVRCGGVRSKLGAGRPTPGGTALLDDPGDGLGAPADFSRYSWGAHAVEVQVDDVVRVEVKPFAGHVYDLSTNAGWFEANGLVIHNSTPDDRTRASHAVADGQIVKSGELFQVGTAKLRYPGDPTCLDGSAVINCRCTLLAFPWGEVQEEIAGEEGSLGEVRPGGVRLGPDDPTDVQTAIEAEKQAQKEWDAENGGFTAAATASGPHDDPIHLQ